MSVEAFRISIVSHHLCIHVSDEGKKAGSAIWGSGGRKMFILSCYLFFQLSQTYIQDYGTLLCYGSNELGTQTEPCVFNIIPAGKQRRKDRKENFSSFFSSFQFSTPTSYLKSFSLSLFLLCELSMHDYIFGVGLGSPLRSFGCVVDVPARILLSTWQANPIHCPIVRY